MKAVITVLGRDMVGILAAVSNQCAESNANIIEVTQSVLQDMFAMVMLADISSLNCPLGTLTSRLEEQGERMGLKIHVMHEDIFNSMHRI